MTSIHTHESGLASVLQSAVDEFVHRQGVNPRRSEHEQPASIAARYLAGQLAAGLLEIPDDPPPDLRERIGDHVHSVWTGVKLVAKALLAKTRGEHDQAQRYGDELKYSNLDPEWAEALAVYIEHFDLEHESIPYVRHRDLDDFVIEGLPPNAVIGLIGDWGSGTAEAEQILTRLAAHHVDALIHLGDIYYGGTPRECKQHFLDVVDRVLGRPANPVPVYTLAGNHDMYAGGHGYYSLLPQLNPTPAHATGRAQPASYFSLRTENGSWQLLALDTGLHDHDPFTVTSTMTWLEPDEEAWHIDKIERFSQAGGRTLLLSHHQPFSAFDPIGRGQPKPTGEMAANSNLLASYRKFQAAAAKGRGDIAAWFWGHEHNLCVYEPYLGVDKGRCIGHGAIPVFSSAEPYATLEGLEDPPRLVADPRHPGRQLQLHRGESVYAKGFVILRLQAATAEVHYYQDSDWNTPMYVETL